MGVYFGRPACVCIGVYMCQHKLRDRDIIKLASQYVLDAFVAFHYIHAVLNFLWARTLTYSVKMLVGLLPAITIQNILHTEPPELSHK